MLHSIICVCVCVLCVHMCVREMGSPFSTRGRLGEWRQRQLSARGNFSHSCLSQAWSPSYIFHTIHKKRLVNPGSGAHYKSQNMWLWVWKFPLPQLHWVKAWESVPQLVSNNKCWNLSLRWWLPCAQKLISTFYPGTIKVHQVPLKAWGTFS